jgi:glycosyltransferase involved in cell wall biosynthesis
VTTPVYLVYHQPTTFMRQSAFNALVPVLGATPLRYDLSWQNLQLRSWTLGHLVRRFGTWYYGSAWNALVPFRDESRFAAAVGGGPCVVHFLWGEFASPRQPGLFRRKGAAIVGTFHCGARRQETVLGGVKTLGSYDRLAVVSETQIPFFVSKGYPREKIRFLPLGVDTSYFHPLAERRESGGPLRVILVGQTERDHTFAAEVMKALPPGTVTLGVCTHPESHAPYLGLDHVKLLPRQSDEELLRLYQEAELMLMPLLDCSANDAMLECMACGTPVMANRVGGVPEYVDAGCNIVMDGKDAGEWARTLTGLARRRDELGGRRPAVRTSAERFGWTALAGEYRRFYEEART